MLLIILRKNDAIFFRFHMINRESLCSWVSDHFLFYFSKFPLLCLKISLLSPMNISQFYFQFIVIIDIFNFQLFSNIISKTNIITILSLIFIVIGVPHLQRMLKVLNFPLQSIYLSKSQADLLTGTLKSPPSMSPVKPSTVQTQHTARPQPLIKK